jgi:group I intron endonuclease
MQGFFKPCIFNMKFLIDKEDENKSGIYIISIIGSPKIYIGQTQCFIKRFRLHKSDLVNTRHGNSHLQNSVNKYGIQNVVFQILELCNKNELNYKEWFWISETDKNILFNSLLPSNETEIITSRGITRNSKVRLKLANRNSTGLAGIRQVSNNRWKCIVYVNGKSVHVGTYDSPETAHKAYLSIIENPESLPIEKDEARKTTVSRQKSPGISGHQGIVWIEKKKKWNFQLEINGKVKSFGMFKNLKDAIIAKEKYFKNPKEYINPLKENLSVSGYVGVHLTKHNMYNSRIGINKKIIHLGNFPTPKEANFHRLEFLELYEQMKND